MQVETCKGNMQNFFKRYIGIMGNFNFIFPNCVVALQPLQ